MPDTWTRRNKPMHDGRADYEIRRNGVLVGRIYHRATGMARDHVWAWYLNQFRGINENGIQGEERTLEKAGQAMKAAFAEVVERRGIVIVERSLLPPSKREKL